jgi:hypothetical protein
MVEGSFALWYYSGLQHELRWGGGVVGVFLFIDRLAPFIWKQLLRTGGHHELGCILSSHLCNVNKETALL